MGQQEIVTGSAAVRRMILVLVVAALMAAMVAATAAPAFAAKGGVNYRVSQWRQWFRCSKRRRTAHP